MNRHRSLCCTLISLSLALIPASVRAEQNPPLIGPGVNHPERHWQVFETPHFQVHYYQGFADFAHLAAETGEAGLARLTEDLGVSLPHKIPLIITEDQFWNGYAEPLRTRIVLDPRFALEPTIGLRRFLLHELTHILNFLAVETPTPLSRLIKSAGLPSWFAEGLAQYEAEYWAPEMDRMLRMHVLEDSLLTPAARNAFIFLGERGGDGYNEGYALVRYLFETYGHHLVKELLANYRHQNISFEQAIALTFGKPLLQLEAEWRDHQSRVATAQLQHRHASLPTAQRWIPYQKGQTWYQPRPSPDGKWWAYQLGNGYPTVRGYVYGLLPLYLAADDTLRAYGQKVASHQQEAVSEAEPPAEQSLQARLRQQHGQDGPAHEPEPAAKIGHELSKRALDFAWRPDSQALAYTTLKPNANGNSTFKVQIQPLKVVNEVLQADGEAVALDPTVSTHSVSWLPDGQSLLAVTESDGRDHIDRYDARTGQRLERLYTAAQNQQLRALALSPDGQQLAFESHLTDGMTQLMLLSLQAAPGEGNARLLTRPGQGQMDRQPVWVPDGRSLYFVSTRTGFADLHQIQPESRQVTRLSQVYSGLDTPSLSPDGQQLSLVRHHAYGTSLEQAPRNSLQPYEQYTEVLSDSQSLLTPPLLPPLQQALDFSPQNYLPWIAPDLFVPVIGRDEVSDQIGFLAQFSDLLDQQALSLLLLYGIGSQRIGFNSSYVNRMFDTSFGIEVGDMPTLSFTTDGSQFFIQREQNVSLFAARPLFNAGSGDTAATRVDRFATVELNISRQSNLTTELNGTISRRQLREGFNNSLTFNFSDNQSRNRKEGYRYSFSLSGGSWLWGSEYSFIASNAEWRQYIPTWGNQTLAYYLAGSAMGGETRPALLGGPPLNNLLVLNFQNIIPLRGFRLAELQGPLMLAANVEYRVPLLPGLYLNLGDHYLTNLELAAYVDAGDAWYPDQRAGFPHIGSGLELRSDVILNRRNPFQLYAGAGKALLGSGGNYLTQRPLEFYGGFISVF